MRVSNQKLVEDLVREVVARYLAISQEGEGTLRDGRDGDGDKPTPESIFNSPQAEAVKGEVVRVGRKLWERQYVDGNGGNISYRITDNWVLCTPTMCSKADLTPASLSLVDLDNKLLCGTLPHTSEILLHLAIYKSVPEARAVVHCHPPHATAFAITSTEPAVGILPESEVFIGPVPISPYDTPGTQAFADTILPYARQHNTILLANHGVVCWSDTVTHAEWLAEVVDTHCRILILAAQIGRPVTPIPDGKVMDLVRLKQRLGLPDPRHAAGVELDPSALSRASKGVTSAEGYAFEDPESRHLDDLIRMVTREVITELSGQGR